MKKKYIHIFCGKGMGKTSSALGKGVREASEGKNVFLIQFLREKRSNEVLSYYKRLEPEMKMFRFEKFPEDYESLTEREKEEEIRPQQHKKRTQFCQKGFNDRRVRRPDSGRDFEPY